jgi:hypothetical protein
MTLSVDRGVGGTFCLPSTGAGFDADEGVGVGVGEATGVGVSIGVGISSSLVGLLAGTFTGWPGVLQAASKTNKSMKSKIAPIRYIFLDTVSFSLLSRE